MGDPAVGDELPFQHLTPVSPAANEQLGAHAGEAVREMALLAGGEAAALERDECFREALRAGRSAPCGHKLRVAPKGLDGQCGCCLSSTIHFCCARPSDCRFRACRRCLGGDLQEQNRQQRTCEEAQLGKAKSGRRRR